MSQHPVPLRIGLILDRTIVPRWQGALINELLRAPYCRVHLVVYLERPESPAPSLRARLAALGPTGTSLTRWYLRLEERWTRSIDDPLAPGDIAAQLHDIPELHPEPMAFRSNELRPDDIERIRGAKLDVLILLGSRLRSGQVLGASRYGVWSLQVGEDCYGGDDARCFREVWAGDPVCSTAVHMATAETGEAIVLCRTSIPTRLGSVAHSRRASHRLGARLIARQLAELHHRGPEAFFARVRDANAALRFDTRAPGHLPSNARFARSLVWHWWGKLVRRIEAHTTQREWMLLYAFGQPPNHALHRYRPLLPPRGRFWADPFVLFEGGKHYVFFEEFEYAVGRGRICALTVDRDGSVSTPATVLERPYHLSYPFLLRWRGELYMIPETGDQGMLEVYRCTRFPDQWEFHARLMHLPLYDATLFEWAERWWLFATMTREMCDTELHLFFAESPLSGSWTPHPANPVVSGVSRARPAGSLFTYNGRLFRPAQDSSRYYGYGVRLQEILALTPHEYRERDVVSILPGWDRGIVGVHHLSFGGDLTVIDAQRRRLRLPGLS